MPEGTKEEAFYFGLIGESRRNIAKFNNTLKRLGHFHG
jgi:xanthine/CO dehydrogenase XdhC/CoxF family maturation factor